jgi:transcriptional regulator with XRE-family HTH domain
LKNVPIFASNYNLNNIMLRVQEICKEQGITMQDLAKKMGVTYQALYAAVSGNPTIGKLGDIAKALGVNVVDLFEGNSQDSEVNGYVKVKGTLYEVHSFEDLKKLLELNV